MYKLTTQWCYVFSLLYAVNASVLLISHQLLLLNVDYWFPCSSCLLLGACAPCSPVCAGVTLVGCIQQVTNKSIYSYQISLFFRHLLFSQMVTMLNDLFWKCYPQFNVLFFNLMTFQRHFLKQIFKKCAMGRDSKVHYDSNIDRSIWSLSAVLTIIGWMNWI